MKFLLSSKYKPTGATLITPPQPLLLFKGCFIEPIQWQMSLNRFNVLP